MSSTFAVEVVRLSGIRRVANSDNLSVADVFDVPCVFKTTDFVDGDLAVYVPENAIVPLTDERFSFLRHARIRPVRLRGQFSEGLLVKPSPGWVRGQDVQQLLGITKWEPGEITEERPARRPRGFFAKLKYHLGFVRSDNAKDPGHMPVYGIEKYGRHKHALVGFPGDVVVTEKLHGMNFRAGFRYEKVPAFARVLSAILMVIGRVLPSSRFAESLKWMATSLRGTFYVGSHNRIKSRDPKNVFWKVALQAKLDKLALAFPGYVFYGEVIGDKVQKNFAYGQDAGNQTVRIFDIYDSSARRFLDFTIFSAVCRNIGLTTVPVLHVGPYEPSVIELLRTGKTTIDGATHIREGIVIKPVMERRHDSCGRVILKLVSEDYKTHQVATDGTEFQ